MFINKQKIEDINKTKESTFPNINDKYTLGFYNALEYVLSILECRNPEFIYLDEQQQEEKQNDEVVRTKISGKRKKNGG